MPVIYFMLATSKAVIDYHVFSWFFLDSEQQIWLCQHHFTHPVPVSTSHSKYPSEIFLLVSHHVALPEDVRVPYEDHIL